MEVDANPDGVRLTLTDGTTLDAEVVEKRQTARKAARWFLPTSAVAAPRPAHSLTLVRLPGVDRYVAATLAGTSTAIVEELRRESQVRPVRTGSNIKRTIG